MQLAQWCIWPCHGPNLAWWTFHRCQFIVRWMTLLKQLCWGLPKVVYLGNNNITVMCGFSLLKCIINFLTIGHSLKDVEALHRHCTTTTYTKDEINSFMYVISYIIALQCLPHNGGKHLNRVMTSWGQLDIIYNSAIGFTAKGNVIGISQKAGIVVELRNEFFAIGWSSHARSKAVGHGIK